MPADPPPHSLLEPRNGTPPSTPERRRVRAEQQRSQETRAALLETARLLFGTKGYHATSIDEIVATTRVTRGALYHHFESKEHLFEAVYRQMEAQLTADAEAGTDGMRGETQKRVLASLHIYLQLLLTRRDWQRILLVDGPAVLGWERWRAIRAEYEYAGWERTLFLLTQNGKTAPAAIAPITQIILAAINEAVLAVAHADNPDIMLTDMTQVLTLLIVSLTQGKA